MKLLAVCGQGLGSSLIVEMNIRDVLQDLNREDINVEHTNLNSFNRDDQELSAVICGRDLAEAINFDQKIVLENLFDKEELKEKLLNFFNA
jgi:galactitol-specific phosphotransferase system IIB component